MAPKKNKKESKEAAKAAKKDKQLKKSIKTKQKQGGITEEVDIDALMFQIGEEERLRNETNTVIEQCNTMGPRNACSASLLPNGSEVLFFGGEYYNGKEVQIYNQLYRLNLNILERYLKVSSNTDDALVNAGEISTPSEIDKNDFLSQVEELDRKEANDCEEESKSPWKLVIPPKNPQPRCSHQGVVAGNYYYIFGGEFATKQQFQHFNDVWRLDLKLWKWELIKTTGKAPHTRSGHRMILYRNNLIVFGGFHDSFREVRYFNDFHILSLKSLKWENYVVSQYETAPKPRSAPIFIGFETLQGALMFGGFQKVKDRGVGNSDSWWLNLQPLAKNQAPKWENMSRKGSYPVGRVGMGYAQYKSKVYAFGGVHDDELGPLQMRSMFFNDLFMFDASSKRWNRLAVGNIIKSAKNDLGAYTKVDQNPDDPADEEDKTISKEYQPHYEDDEDDHEFVYMDQNGILVRIDISKTAEFELDEEKSSTDKNAKLKETENVDHKGEKEEEDVPLLLDEINNNTTSVKTKKVKTKRIKKKGKRHENESEDDAVNDEGVNVNESQTASKKTPPNTTPKKETPQVKGIFAKDMLGALASTKYPPPRLNPVMWFKGSNLFVYGGLVEVGSREITLNDLWSVNVLTRKEWRCLSRGTLDEQIWYDDPLELQEQAEEGDSGEDGDSDDVFSDSMSSSEYSNSEFDDEDDIKAVERQAKKKAARTADLRTRIAYYNDQLPEDKSLCPLLGETLKDFNERTKQKFFEEACNQPRDEYYTPDEKELRRDAFKLCQRTYYNFKPILDALQKLYLRSDEANRLAKERDDRANAINSGSITRK